MADFNPDRPELVLWAIPKGKTDFIDAVVLLSSAPSLEHVERIKAMAAKDGFHSFRVQKIDGTPPDFLEAINI